MMKMEEEGRQLTACTLVPSARGRNADLGRRVGLRGGFVSAGSASCSAILESEESFGRHIVTNFMVLWHSIRCGQFWFFRMNGSPLS